MASMHTDIHRAPGAKQVRVGGTSIPSDFIATLHPRAGLTVRMRVRTDGDPARSRVASLTLEADEVTAITLRAVKVEATLKAVVSLAGLAIGEGRWLSEVDPDEASPAFAIATVRRAKRQPVTEERLKEFIEAFKATKAPGRNTNERLSMLPYARATSFRLLKKAKDQGIIAEGEAL